MPSPRPAASSFQEHVIKQTFPKAHPWLGVALLIALVVMAYRGVWKADFIWDDDVYLTHNPCIIGPLNFWHIWTTNHARICPLVISSFWLQYQLWGLNPLGYHLVTVAFHAASAVVLWRTLRVLKVPGAWLGAALWAIHPVQVESVAWISELKNTQSGLFYTLCAYFWARWETGGGTSRRQYVLAVLFAALAMASKSSTVVLPPVLLIVSWWLGGRIPWQRWKAIIPFVLLALGAVAWSMVSQDREGANETEWARSVPERLITAGHVMWFYLGKLAWPQPLMFIYPRWNVNPAAWLEWLPLAGCVAVTALLVLVRNTCTRAAAFAGAVFVVALLPVAGLVDHYFLRYSFVGDHFVYLASMGPLALLAAGLTRLADKLGAWSWDIVSLFDGTLVVALGFVSAAHVPVFEDDVKLWGDSFQRNPDSWITANNLGVAYMQKGDAESARQLYEVVLHRQAKNAMAAGNLGATMLHTNGARDAEGFLQKAAQSFPRDSSIWNNLGLAQSRQRHSKEAIASFRKAIELNGANGEAHLNLANELLQTHHDAEAVAAFRDALKYLPARADLCLSYATALLNSGDAETAIEYYQKSLKQQPGSVIARYNLGNALAQAGRTREAVEAWEAVAAQGSSPALIETVHNLAWVLATTTDDKVRNGRRALEVLQKIQDHAESKDPVMMRVWAAAQFETGDKEAAAKTAQNALLLATAASNEPLIQALKDDLEGYRAGKPVRIAPSKPAAR